MLCINFKRVAINIYCSPNKKKKYNNLKNQSKYRFFFPTLQSREKKIEEIYMCTVVFV